MPWRSASEQKPWRMVFKSTYWTDWTSQSQPNIHSCDPSYPRSRSLLYLFGRRISYSSCHCLRPLCCLQYDTFEARTVVEPEMPSLCFVGHAHKRFADYFKTVSKAFTAWTAIPIDTRHNDFFDSHQNNFIIWPNRNRNEECWGCRGCPAASYIFTRLRRSSGDLSAYSLWGSTPCQALTYLSLL